MNIEKLESDKGNHIIIKILPNELVNISQFGIASKDPNEFKNSFRCIMSNNETIYRAFICDDCNDTITDLMYYVPVMNRLYCKNCIDDIMRNTPFYMTDAVYELEKYNMFIDMMNENAYLSSIVNNAGMSKIDDLYDYLYMHLHIGDFTDFENNDFDEYVKNRDSDKSKIRIFRNGLSVKWDNHNPESLKGYIVSDILNSNNLVDGKIPNDSERILLIKDGSFEFEVPANELTII